MSPAPRNPSASQGLSSPAMDGASRCTLPSIDKLLAELPLLLQQIQQLPPPNSGYDSPNSVNQPHAAAATTRNIRHLSAQRASTTVPATTGARVTRTLVAAVSGRSHGQKDRRRRSPRMLGESPTVAPTSPAPTKSRLACPFQKHDANVCAGPGFSTILKLKYDAQAENYKIDQTLTTSKKPY